MSSTQTLTVTILDVLETGTGTNRTDITGAKVLYASATGIESGKLTGFRIKFNEAITTSTFTTADLSLLSPTNAALTFSSVTAVPNTNNTEFILTLSTTQTTPGNYVLKVGPDIRDLAGNQMNQDNDSMNGELTQDQYVGSFSLFTTYSFNNTSNTPIKDLTTTKSVITINQVMNIKDINIFINIAHTADSDLVITLTSPTGQSVVLSNRRGAWGDNFTNTLFDDDASNAISTGTAPFTGTFKPESVLSIFNEKNAKGNWTLTIEDKAGGDVGKLISWKLIVLTNTKLTSTANLASARGGSITVTNPSASMANFSPALANAIVNTSSTTTTRTSTPTSSHAALPNSSTTPANSLIPNASSGSTSASSSQRPTAQQAVADQLFSGLFRI